MILAGVRIRDHCNLLFSPLQVLTVIYQFINNFSLYHIGKNIKSFIPRHEIYGLELRGKLPSRF